MVNNSGQRKNFIPRQEIFTCEHCQAVAPLAHGTFRNHCPQCLYSKHVDATIPGDRAATCGGLMRPIAIEGTDPDQLDIVHQCEQCGKTIRNKTASDDNREAIWQIMSDTTH